MELTYEANLPLLRKLAIMLAVTGLGGGSFDEAPGRPGNEASDDFEGLNMGTGKSDEQIEKEAEEILDLHGNAILRLAISYLHNKEDAYRSAIIVIGWSSIAIRRKWRLSFT